MYVDAQLTFSDAQAVTATAGSTNVIDTGPLFSGNTGRNLGVGHRAYVIVNVDVAMTDAGSDSTITVTLETDDNAAFSSAATVATLGVIPALTAAGAVYAFGLPIAGSVPYERYIRLMYTTTNGNLTTGSFTASITTDASIYAQYAPGFATGI
ncbi:hypothetical protein IVB03_39505 [Bradyrhizobium sp. 168]|uniref:Bbp16 family capsid cement protein n=1 Tax=Bradyrhizobium sp. 168 TaxID=2782639 RepID=UPI001FFAE6C8|nr:hypothetical protein [Bradyrhizobium sp. 168]MCK1585483.1 hypothetical protein [Bradyrhizobium sp. 168]